MSTKPLVRRKVEELKLMYSLEPTLRDLYVEGESDKRFLRLIYNSMPLRDQPQGIYPIDEIEISDSTLRKHDLNRGNRSEVIALCLELESEFGVDFRGASGIADRDFDDIFLIRHNCGLLLKTDYACMECYWMHPDYVQKLFIGSFPKIEKSASEVLASLSDVLRDLFLFRATSVYLRLGISWIASQDIDCESGAVVFDANKFREKYLKAGGAWSRREEFDRKASEFRKLLGTDSRSFTNGHDFIELLSIYIRSYYKKSADSDRAKPHVLPFILSSCVKEEEILKHGLFQEIFIRLNT